MQDICYDGLLSLYNKLLSSLYLKSVWDNKNFLNFWALPTRVASHTSHIVLDYILLHLSSYQWLWPIYLSFQTHVFQYQD